MSDICAVYKIVNKVTGDTYIGSSTKVHKRWRAHKSPSTWKLYSHRPLYKAILEYGIEQFDFVILYQSCPTLHKQLEQAAIELYKPSYNQMRANGRNYDGYKKYYSEYGKVYNHQECIYNGRKVSLHTLACTFWRKGIKNPVLEAKKYLI